MYWYCNYSYIHTIVHTIFKAMFLGVTWYCHGMFGFAGNASLSPKEQLEEPQHMLLLTPPEFNPFFQCLTFTFCCWIVGRFEVVLCCNMLCYSVYYRAAPVWLQLTLLVPWCAMMCPPYMHRIFHLTSIVFLCFSSPQDNEQHLRTLESVVGTQNQVKALEIKKDAVRKKKKKQSADVRWMCVYATLIISNADVLVQKFQHCELLSLRHVEENNMSFFSPKVKQAEDFKA